MEEKHIFYVQMWRRKKTDNDNEEILFRRGWKKREGRGNIIWMTIFLAEETKKREGKRGKYVLWEIIQIISNKLEPPRGSQQKLGICKNISIQRGRRAAEVFSDSLAGIIINDVRGVVRRKSWHYDVEDHFGEIRRLSWAKYHTQPFLDKRMSWPSAQEKEQNGLGTFWSETSLSEKLFLLQYNLSPFLSP